MSTTKTAKATKVNGDDDDDDSTTTSATANNADATATAKNNHNNVASEVAFGSTSQRESDQCKEVLTISDDEEASNEEEKKSMTFSWKILESTKRACIQNKIKFKRLRSHEGHRDESVRKSANCLNGALREENCTWLIREWLKILKKLGVIDEA